MKFPQYISTRDRVVRVVGMIDKEYGQGANKKENGVFIDGKGYLDENGHIWIYSGCGKPENANVYPYFWLDDDRNKKFSNPTVDMLNRFSEQNLDDVSKKNIIASTDTNEELYNEQEIIDINSATAVFVPIIYDTDDFLKKIIKTAIIEKGIDINRLKYKMDAKYSLPNMKAALMNKTKMSTTYFLQWVELLGLDFNLTVIDNGFDTTDPLKEPLSYVSYKDSVLKTSEV